MIILGLNYFHPDSSACILKNGKLIAAVEEERFVRIKHFSGFPENSINFCLKFLKIQISDIDIVALNYNPKSNIRDKIIYSLKNIYKFSTLKKIYNQKNKSKNKNELEIFLKKKKF